MFGKRLILLGAITLQLATSACAKIDHFDSPHMLEGFTGIVKVTPGIEGITAKTYTPGLFFFNSNKDGTQATMYGPITTNFSLYSMLPDDPTYKKDFRDKLKEKGVSALDKLDFSGFKATVDKTDGRKITINSFADQSEGMKKFHWKVTGTGIIDGPDSHIVVKIATTVGDLKDVLPEEMTSLLAVPGTNESIAESTDLTHVVYLAQLDILGESLTFGY